MNRTRIIGGMAAFTLALVTAAPFSHAQKIADPPQERAPGGRSVDLRPKFVKGQEIRFKMTMRAQGVAPGLPTDLGAPEGDGASSQEMTIKLKVKDTNAETGSTLEMEYEQLKVRMGEVTFDSTKPAKDDDAVDEIFRSIVGLKMNIQMDPAGNISSVTHEGGGGVGDLLSQQFTGADVVKGLFGPITTRGATDGMASVGDSWKTEDTMRGAMGDMRLAMTHTLESARAGRAVIKTKGRVVLDGSEGASLGIRIKDSTITGTTDWDLETGMLSRMTQDNRIEVETPDADGKKQTKTNTMHVEVTRVR